MTCNRDEQFPWPPESGRVPILLTRCVSINYFLHAHSHGWGFSRPAPFGVKALKRAFHSRPPLPRYTGTWDVSKVLSLLAQQDISDPCSLKVLSMRTAMLLALTQPLQLADLTKLDLKDYRISPEGVVFSPSGLAQQARPRRKLRDFFLPRFPENHRLCPVVSLERYIHITQPLLGDLILPTVHFSH